MKPKEYIKKFKFENGYNKDQQKDFFADLSRELTSIYESFEKVDDEKSFDNSVNIIMDKWKAISNKIPFGLSDGLWNFFYATNIIPIKNVFCYTFKCRKDREKEIRNKREENRKKQEEIFRNKEEEIFRNKEEEIKRQRKAYFEALFFASLSCIPYESFKYFNLDIKASEEQILEAFRKKVLIVHPDKGGNKEKFVECIENKNKCLEWIYNKQI